ncbi:hypothetical protein [Mesorhizobium sp.]|uniref:hypothetical protein n=1 Tax=Mesorhizobium sp. TaxID=1871066 RepID=UPI0025F07EB7|nr:hypothetical protein [Mesorhizobium sp.]
MQVEPFSTFGRRRREEVRIALMTSCEKEKDVFDGCGPNGAFRFEITSAASG